MVIVQTSFESNKGAYGKGCLYKPYHENVNDVIASLESLLGAVKRCNNVHLLGGEPLLYPDLYEILDYLRSKDNVNHIGITTNRTLLIKEERVKNLLKDSKFFVTISNYGDAVSKKFQELVQQLKESNIRCEVRLNESPWVDFGEFDNRNRTEGELNNMFTNCGYKGTCVVLGGKFYRCSRSAHGANLGLIPSKKEDYVVLSGGKNVLRNKLFKYLYRDYQYIESCKYCDMVENPKQIQAGVQSK